MASYVFYEKLIFYLKDKWTNNYEGTRPPSFPYTPLIQ